MDKDSVTDKPLPGQIVHAPRLAVGKVKLKPDATTCAPGAFIPETGDFCGPMDAEPADVIADMVMIFLALHNIMLLILIAIGDYANRW